MKYISLELVKFDLAVDITGKKPEEITRKDIESVDDETAISWIELMEFEEERKWVAIQSITKGIMKVK